MIALTWAIFSEQSLTLAQLEHAICLTMYPDETTTQHERRVDTKDYDLLEATGYLLDLDPDSKTIQVHKAIRDFCDDANGRAEYFPDALVNTAEACLRCLSPTYLKCTPQIPRDLAKMTKKAPLLAYAARHWGWHVERALEANDMKTTDRLARIEDTVVDSMGMDSFLTIMNYALGPVLHTTSSNDGYHTSEALRPIHILAHFRLHPIISRWLRQFKDHENPRAAGVDLLTKTPSWTYDTNGHTALWQACRAGQEETALFLLQEGADPEQENEDRRFVLNEACFRGLTKVVKYILKLPRNVTERCMKQYDEDEWSCLTNAIMSDLGPQGTD